VFFFGFDFRNIDWRVAVVLALSVLAFFVLFLVLFFALK
jgi:hypothetical protein